MYQFISVFKGLSRTGNDADVKFLKCMSNGIALPWTTKFLLKNFKFNWVTSFMLDRNSRAYYQSLAFPTKWDQYPKAHDGILHSHSEASWYPLFFISFWKEKCSLKTASNSRVNRVVKVSRNIPSISSFQSIIIL